MKIEQFIVFRLEILFFISILFTFSSISICWKRSRTVRFHRILYHVDWLMFFAVDIRRGSQFADNDGWLVELSHNSKPLENANACGTI